MTFAAAPASSWLDAWPHGDVEGERAQAAIAFLVLAVASALLLRRRPAGVGYAVRAELRLPHLLPAILQTTLLSYLWLYWRNVQHHLPTIALQLVFAYAIDAVLSFRRGPTWVVTVGPLPVVVSLNLFVWWARSTYFLSFVAIALAIGSKHWIRRDGRHVFNPSAFAAGTIGLVIFPFLDHYVDFNRELHLPANMWELLFLLSLVPMVRFGTGLLTLAAALGLSLLPGHGASMFNVGFFLAITLFATDPATIPRTPVGRILFGLFIGVSIATLSRISPRYDFFTKVWPVMAANALRPWFDRLGGRVSWPSADTARGRWALAAAWVLWALAAHPLGEIKARQQMQLLQEERFPPRFVEREADGALRPERNPVYSRPFSFREEWRMWRTGRQGS